MLEPGEYNSFPYVRGGGAPAALALPRLSIGQVVGLVAIPRQILENILYTHKALPSDDHTQIHVRNQLK